MHVNLWTAIKWSYFPYLNHFTLKSQAKINSLYTEIIDTLGKALKLQIHTLLFIFPTKKFRTLWLSRNCLSTLQFSFRHTFPPPQLWRVFFPAPNKETGSPGRDFAAQISCSLGGSEESQGLTQARHTLRCLFTAQLVKEAHPSPGLAGPGRMHSVDAAPSKHSGFFPQSWHKTGSSAATTESFPWHWWLCLLLWLCWSCRAACY